MGFLKKLQTFKFFVSTLKNKQTLFKNTINK